MKPRFRTAIRLGLLALSILCTACSSKHYFINSELPADQPVSRYAIPDIKRQEGNSDSLHVMVSLSGGGYRAAALSYAVLDALNKTTVQWEGQSKSLLDEVDVIASVSGGSLAAADFVINRSDFFPGFETRVLGLDLQSKALSRFISPSGLWSQTSNRYGRGDLLQNVLDEELFHGITFGDLPKQRPAVVLNATDIHSGERFGFTQDEFDHLCSDLSRFPVSRAIAASMAVPVLASPITVWNHSEKCAVPRNLDRAIPFIDSARYLHLSDGGLADNIGVRTPLELIAGAGGLLESTRRIGYRGVRRTVFIIVNALPAPPAVEDDTPDTPGLWRQFRSIYSVPIDRTSADGVGLLRAAVDRWTQQLQQVSEDRLDGLLAKDLQFHVIEVSLRTPLGLGAHSPLSQMPTELRISPAEVQRIKEFVASSLAKDSAWQAMLDDLRTTGAR
jgi:NTE family protein